MTSRPESGDLERIAGSADVLEVRADLTPDLDPDSLRDRFPGRLLYTLRSREEGGRFSGDLLERQTLLEGASHSFDLIDLEAERDLDPHLLAQIAPRRRVLSWHGDPAPVDALVERLEEMSETPAAVYKLVPGARRSGQELLPLRLLAEVERRDVIAFATGPIGTWSRLVAPRLGAPVVFGSVGEAAAPGQPSLKDLILDHALPELYPADRLCGLVGDPVDHSLSPRLHNGAYRSLGLPYLYLPFHVEEFGEFWLEVVEDDFLAEIGLPLVGLSVTTPHKTAALAVAGVASPLADRLNAANTLDLRDGVWEAENTDVEGVTRALEEREIPVEGRSAVVVGAGRAGRAAAFGLARKGAETTIANRSRERGRTVAELLDLPFVSLEELDPGEFEIVVHATSLGRQPGDEVPVDPAALRTDGILVELVYGAGPTLLEREARERGVTVVDGREVLVAQALRQFQLFTGREIPISLGREILEMAS
ncbi:MAG: type I 3-dehydroquinate dehydratase [Thermoanaerobaculia bacterium]|nr:type I 3-dehydroquinate dehydratase [Thermoanaerobaculia bacterium]